MGSLLLWVFAVPLFLEGRHLHCLAFRMVFVYRLRLIDWWWDCWRLAPCSRCAECEAINKGGQRVRVREGVWSAEIKCHLHVLQESRMSLVAASSLHLLPSSAPRVRSVTCSCPKPMSSATKTKGHSTCTSLLNPRLQCYANFPRPTAFRRQQSCIDPKHHLRDFVRFNQHISLLFFCIDFCG